MTAERIEFEAIGTTWDISINDELKDRDWLNLKCSIAERIERFDEVYSRFRADSFVNKLATAAGRYTMPPDACELFNFYGQLYDASGGKVTPAIGQALSDAGYDSAYSFKAKTLQSPPDWRSVMRYDKYHLIVKRPVLFDFGAAGKGYLVDIIGNLIAEAGIQNYTINAGGDIKHRSARKSSLRVGLENPVDLTEVIGIASLSNSSLCASSSFKRRWDKFHHILDPASLTSPRHVIATWVIADDTMTADGIATALFFTAAEDLSRHFSFSYALLDKDMNFYCDQQFPVELFEGVS